MDYFVKLVLVAVTADEAKADTEGKIVGSRWINCNKGDSINPDVRCRLVAQEVANEPDHNFYAATPPLEAKRLLFSQWASEQTAGSRKPKLSFVDIRKAYFNGTPLRSIYLRLPKELGLPSNVLGKLVKCCYGTRDAGSIWEQCYVDALIGMGFAQGVASPCSFRHEAWGVAVVVHGDDFTALGTDHGLNLYEQGLAKCFECKLKGRLGLGPKDEKEMRVLNRIVRVSPEGLSYEADPRHCELLAKSLGLQEAKTVATPGVKKPFSDEVLDLDLNEDVTTTALSPLLTRLNLVTFSDEVITHPVTPYSESYGRDLRKFVFGRNLEFLKISKSCDPSTGIERPRPPKKPLKEPPVHEERRAILKRILDEGAAWEVPTNVLVAKVSKKFLKKRVGAKAAKKAERFASIGE